MRSILYLTSLLLIISFNIYAQGTSFTAYEAKVTNLENGKSLTNKVYISVLMTTDMPTKTTYLKLSSGKLFTIKTYSGSRDGFSGYGTDSDGISCKVQIYLVKNRSWHMTITYDNCTFDYKLKSDYE